MSALARARLAAGSRLRTQFLVADGEAGAAAYFLGLFFVIGTGFALGRGSASSLFLQRFGIEYLPHTLAVLAVAILVASLAYAAIADRIRPDRLLVVLMAMLLVALLPLWLAMGMMGLPLAYPAYFVTFHVFSEVLLLQCTLYFAMSFDGSQSKRLLPIALAGLQAGEMCGGLGLTALASLLPMQHVAPAWCALVAVAAGFVLLRHRGGRSVPHMSPARKSSRPWRAAAAQLAQGMRFSRSSALLRSLALATLFMVIAVHIMEYAALAIYAGAFRSEQELGIVFGLLTFICGAITLLVQLFFSGKLLRLHGVRAMNLVFPVGLLAAFAALAASFRVPAALAGSVVQRTLLPAMRNPSRALLFQALPDHIQGRARALSVAIVLPAGILVAAFITRTVPADSQHWLLPLVGLLAAAGCLAYSIAANRCYPSALLDTLGEKLFVARGHLGRLDPQRDRGLLHRLSDGVRHPDDSVALACAHAMAEAFPGEAWRHLVDRARAGRPATRDQLIRLVADRLPAAQRGVLRGFLAAADDHGRSTILSTLFGLRDPESRAMVADCLHSANPRLAACGIQGVHDYAITALLPAARARWRELLESREANPLLAALELVRNRPEPDWVGPVLAAWEHPEPRVRRSALAALECLAPVAGGALAAWVNATLLSDSPEERAAALRSAVDLPNGERLAHAEAALADPHPRVSEAAVQLLDGHHGADFSEVSLDRLAAGALPLRAQRALLTGLVGHPVPSRRLAGYAVHRSQEALALAATLPRLRHGALPGQAPWLRGLLVTAVEEHVLECADLALHALESIEDGTDLRRVRAAISSREARHFARALEAIEGLRSREVALTLRRTLEHVRGDAPLEHAAAAAPASFSQVVDFLSQHPDSFLRECARRAQPAASGAGA